MTRTIRHEALSGFQPVFPPVGLRRGVSRLLDWHDRQLQRAALARLDTRLLDDVGLDPAEASAEARRWD